MIFDMQIIPLIEEYQAARKDEAVATNNLLTAMRSGNTETVILEKLKLMENTHAKAMSIYDQLQHFAG